MRTVEAVRAAPKGHTRTVPRRVSSPTLVGRADQIEALAAAVEDARAGRSRIVLVAGDAGIGKTRLITDACDAFAAEGVTAVVGGCIQLGEVSVAFAPFIEALRHIRLQLGPDDFAAVLGDGRDDVGAMIGGKPLGDSRDSGPMFEHLLGLLGRLGDRHPLFLVIEDIHWADASTRDALTYLGRNLRGMRVVLVLTYRADELHRRHPLRPVIADLERAQTAETLSLAGLDRDAVAQLIDQISEAPTTDRDLDELCQRSGGNPFFVEELVAAGGLGAALPAPLADVILNRVDLLSETTRRVLQRAAVVGQEVDEEIVADVCGLAQQTVADSLHEAVAQNLLVRDSSGCRFRHALVREALYDDLLPGERERIHIATAEAVSRQTRLADHVRWALLAHHWNAAHDVARALESSFRAGVEAEKVHAIADAAAQFERALSLFDRVPAAEQLIGLTRVDLMLRAAETTWQSSRSSRGVDLIEAALAEMGDAASPEKRAVAYTVLGRVRWVLRDGPAAVTAYEHAVGLVRDRPQSREQALAWASLGQSLMLREMDTEAEASLRKAIEVAVAVDAPDVRAHALSSLCGTVIDLGRVDEGVEAGQTSVALNRELGKSGEACRAYVNLAYALWCAGRYEQAATIGREGIAYALRVGHMQHYGEAIAGNIVLALTDLGRWAEADEILAHPRLPRGEAYLELRALPLALARGQLDEAADSVARCLAGTQASADVQFRGVALLSEGELLAMRGDYATGLDRIDQALERALASEDQIYAHRAFASGLRTLADWAESVRAGGSGVSGDPGEIAAAADEMLARLDKFEVRKQSNGSSLLPPTAVDLAAARTDHARVRADDSAATWLGVAAQWDGLNRPIDAAWARHRAAAAILRDGGDRAEAEALARQAFEAAAAVGARPLERVVGALARRARLDLAVESTSVPGPDEAATALSLTPRELEVLRLLAEGRTNRQVGETLFISEKTASVHVTNLLRKLAVGNRLEAVAVGRRAGLLG